MIRPVSDRAPAQRLERSLGLMDVFAICTGAMVSSGIFLLPGIAFVTAGSGLAFAYLLAGLMVVPAMLSAAELATAMPRAGGPYYFLDRALGPLVGIIGGTGVWFALVFKSAFALVGISAYGGLFLDLPIGPLAAAIAVLFTALNILGAKKTSWLQILLVALLVGVLAWFVLAGAAAMLADPATTATRFAEPFPGGFEVLIATTGLVFVSYAGITQVASVAEEVNRPARTIPLGMTLSLVVTMLLYAGGVAAMTAVLPADAFAGDLTPVASASHEIMPQPAGLVLITLAAVAAFASTGNAGILSAARYPLAMARDGLLWRRLASIGRFGTPTVAVLSTGVVITAVVLLLDVEAIAALASAFILLIFMLLNLAVIVMRASGIAAYDPAFRSPLYPWMQVLGIVAMVVLIVQIGWLSVLFTAGLVVCCLAWWRWWARGRVARDGAIYHWFERLGQRRDHGLDAELVGIVQEEGLREEDRFDEIVARALVIDSDGSLTLSEAVDTVCQHVGVTIGADPQAIRQRADRSETAVAGGAVINSALMEGQVRPELVMLRAGEGLRDVGGPRAAPPIALFLVLGGHGAAGTVLRSLAQLAAHAESPTFRKEWLRAADELELKEVLLRDERFLSLQLRRGSAAEELAGRRLRELGLPHGTLVALIRRDGETIVPDGEVRLERGDRLTIVGQPAGVRALAERYQARRRHG